MKPPKKLLALLLALFLLPLPVLAAEAEPDCPEFDGWLVSIPDAAAENYSALHRVAEGLYLAPDAAAAREALPDAEGLEPNYAMTVQDYAPAHWAQQMIDAAALWDHTDSSGAPDLRGGGVTVAVIDSGVMAEHPDLTEANVLDPVILSGGTAAVDSWHGTFVAGLIAAAVGNGIGTDGVAPDVTILPICVTQRDNTSVARVVEAIYYAIDAGADVINLSIAGSSYTEALESACADAEDAGVILVTAAGNYTTGAAKSEYNYKYPAAFASTVSVSGCMPDGDGAVFDPGYSYFNDAVTVCAPGTGVTSLFLDGSTATRSGTSFSAPLVAGLAAAAKQRSRSIGTAEFVALLEASCTDLGEPGCDVYYGYGLVNAAAFAETLDLLYPAEEPDPEPEPEPEPEPDPEPTPTPEPAEDLPALTAAEMRSALDAGVLPALAAGDVTVTLRRAAAEALLGSGAETLEVRAERTETGVSLTFYADGAETELTGGVAVAMPAPEDGTLLPCLNGTPLAFSTVADGTLRFLAPGGGDFTLEARAAAFADTADHWAESSVARLAARGVLLGDGERFRPDDAVTRAQLAAILVRLWESAFGALPEGETAFSDCAEDAWYSHAVRALAAAGVVSGFPDGAFRPDEPVTRGQMAVMLARFAALLELRSADAAEPFADAAAIPGWAAEAAEICRRLALLTGDEQGNFKAEAPATRAQCAAIAERLIAGVLG